MAYGIGSILGDVDQKADTFRDNPDALAQMYQQNQQLVDLLALQKIKSDKEAAMRDMQMKMQAPAATIKDQREQEVMDMTRAEVAEQMAPGLQMLAQQQQNAQQPPQGQPPSGMEGGLPSLPAPNMQGVGMADGGIVGYQQGGGVDEDIPISMEALRKFDERRRVMQELIAAGVSKEQAEAIANDPASGQNVLREAMAARSAPGGRSVNRETIGSGGTPAQNMPVSAEDLRKFEESRKGVQPPSNVDQLLAQMAAIGEPSDKPSTRALGSEASPARKGVQPPSNVDQLLAQMATIGEPSDKPSTRALGPDASLARPKVNDQEFIPVFTTPTGQILTVDDLVMMRNADRIPSEMMLTDSSGRKVTVSDAIFNPMSRSNEIDLTEEGTARREQFYNLPSGAYRSPVGIESLMQAAPASGQNVPREAMARPRVNDQDFETMLASMLGEDVAPQSNAPSRKLEEGAPVERQSAYDIRQAEKARGRAGNGIQARQYAELMSNPPPPDAAVEYAKTFFGETPQAAETTPSANQRVTANRTLGPDASLARQRVTAEPTPARATSPARQSVNAESTLAPDAGISRLTSPTAEAAAIQAYDTRAAAQPLQTAAPQTAAPQDAGIGRYEQQYDNLLTQQEDKLDKLITFLLSAGASRGTNLGATLTGGGVGLQNRDARIKAEIDDTIKNIEALKLDREKMQMDQSRFESDLALRRDVAEANKSQAQADSAQRMALAKMDIESAEDLAELNNKAAQTIRDSANQDTITRGQNDNNRAMFNAAQKAAIELRKQLLDGNFDDDGKTKLELELELAKTNEHLIKLQTQLERFSGDNIDYDSLED